MIFRPELAALVCAGRKTQTRRKAVAGEQPHYVAGRTYSVQPGRGQAGIGRVLVVDVERQSLGALTQQAAVAEGFRFRREFFIYWRELHGLGLRRELRDVLERLVDAPATLPVERLHPGLSVAAAQRRLAALEQRDLVKRVGQEWDITDAGAELLIDDLDGLNYDQQVWAITFELLKPVTLEPKPHYLTPAARPAGTTKGYTTRTDKALELVEIAGTEDLDVRWQTTSLADQVEARHGGSLEERLTRARELARQRGVDIGHLERALQDRISRAATRDPVRFAVMVEKRLRAIENKVWAAA